MSVGQILEESFGEEVEAFDDGDNGWSVRGTTTGSVFAKQLHESTARLIVAAPDMLAVLQEVAPYLPGNFGPNGSITLQAKAAIKKATGVV